VAGLIDEGRKLLAEARHDAAITRLEQAHELDPANRDVEKELAAAREAQREHQEREKRRQELAKVVQGVERLIAKANLEGASSDLEAAIQRFGEDASLTALKPKIADLEKRLRDERVAGLIDEGRKLLAEARHDAAITTLEQAHELDPANRDVEKELAAARRAVSEAAQPSEADEPTIPLKLPDDDEARAAAGPAAEGLGEDTVPVEPLPPARPEPSRRRPAAPPQPIGKTAQKTAEPAVAPAREPSISKARKPRTARSPIVWGGVAATAIVVVIGALLLVRSLGAPGGEADTAARQEDRVPAAAAPAGGLAINALPWAEVVEVVDQDGDAQELPPDRNTPMFLGLPAGTYRVTLRPPDGAPPMKVEAEITGEETTRLLQRFEVMDVDEFLDRYGFAK
jgi:hypothetical protein